MKLNRKEKLPQKTLPTHATKKLASKNSKTFTTLATSLVKWFSESARDLPWRKNPANPYEIWISEIMSQQSTLKMMLPFFEKWMKTFPDLISLAEADEELVLKHWEGLGYYSRARNIHRAAKILKERFPQSPDELLEIPGIGPYTSAAIASIAFDYPAIAVDGNVTRVLSRYFGIANPFADKDDAKKIQDIARELAQYSKAGERGALTQALMELGAMVCKPNSQVKCFECPIQKYCVAKKAGKAELWPLPKKRAPLQKISRLLLIYRDGEGRPLLRKRPPHLPLGGQWELPYLDLEAQVAELQELFSAHFELRKPYKHTIMSKSFTVLPMELGRGPRAAKGELDGHQYYEEGFKGVLSTISRKYLGQISKKSID